MNAATRFVLTLVALLSSAAFAAEPNGADPNACTNPGGQGEPCTNAASCELNAYATACLEHEPGVASSRRCEIPCQRTENGNTTMDRAACATGEVCVEGKALPGQKAFWCKPAKYRMTLDLLDKCIAHYLGGLQPAFSDNACSLESNLNRFLDQDSDGSFSIYDMDLCVLAFLEQPGCDLEAGTCDADDLIPCAADADCGDGLYCDPARHTCQRDCGVVASREPSIDALDVECSGALKVCDYSRGRCTGVDVTTTTCATDSQCPSGAYCLLGLCAPRCYRSVDCPGSDWYCDVNNHCRALPSPDADQGFVFDPKGYAIRFSREGLALTDVQTADSSPMVIMDLLSKKQVVGNPAVGFGYRLEITYNVKQDAKCLAPFTDCAKAAKPAECEALQKDCLIDPTEQWIRALTPFGTVDSSKRADIRVELEPAVADALSAGVYTARVRVIFDNGDSDSIPVSYTKASPSGRYVGSLTVGLDGQKAVLNANRPFTLGMNLYVSDEWRAWNTLMADNNISTGDALVDVTQGYVVSAVVDGTSALPFALPSALKTSENLIPFVGLYSPDLGRIRLIAVVDLPSDFCIAEGGECASAGAGDLVVKNTFGRTIRRRIELAGPFDAAGARFHGLYREKLTGLLPSDITLEGGFLLNQAVSDGTPVVVDKLLPAPTPAAPFPEDAEVLAELDAVIAVECAGGDPTDPASKAWAVEQFANQNAFAAYTAGARRRGPATPASPLGRTTVFPGLLEFSEALAGALAALGGEDALQQTALNVYDFVANRILPCDPDDPSPPAACVDESAARCGLALHQRALVQGWIAASGLPKGQDGSPSGGNDLFCVDTIPTLGCADASKGNETLFLLQEHNRFWRDLAQILKFSGDRARSDAFLVLFRNALNPFAAGAALSYKGDSLRKAVAQYDALIETFVGRPATRVLSHWPAAGFKANAFEWLKLMHTIVSDRMGALAELVDLERRVFAGTGGDTVFADHMMQQEFLLQVYLLALERQWEGVAFAYEGQAAAVLDRGQAVLQQLDHRRNAIGVQGEVVFFETQDPETTNWLHYHDQLVGDGGDGGLVAEAQDAIDGAVENLQASLADMDALEASLDAAAGDLDDTLAELCGDPNPADPTGVTSDYCQYLLKQYVDSATWIKDRDCLLKGGTGCPKDSHLACEEYNNFIASPTGNCEGVKSVFLAGSQVANGEAGASGPWGLASSCMVGKDSMQVLVNGVPRACVGGAMGALLQEKALVERQRRNVLQQLRALVDSMNSLTDLADQTKGLNAGSRVLHTALTATVVALDQGLAITDGLAVSLKEKFQAGNCIVIAGLAIGSDCVQRTFVALGTFSVEQATNSVTLILNAVKAAAEWADDVQSAEWDFAKELLGFDMEAIALGEQVHGLIDTLLELNQTALNLGAQIEDLKYQIQYASDGYQDTVSFVADHLVGRETGFILLGDHLVRDASDTFQRVVRTAYRMAMAFVHHYNLTPAEGQALANQALALITLDEARDFVKKLETLATEYCGAEAIDCDFNQNVRTLRFSVREQLFPSLRDVVDGKTGLVITAGQQFHNLITQPPYYRRRIRGVHAADQLEISLPLPVGIQENVAGGPSWLIDPLECNQHLDGADGGNVAVNVVGQNLGTGEDAFSYELVRGGVDLIRACRAESVVKETGTLPVLDYPIRRHVVGYAPQSSQAQESVVPAFVARSSAFAACLNVEGGASAMAEAPCWNYFARGRSLAALDWKLIVPLFVGGAAMDSAWIAGAGLPAEKKPVIEDIVVYFRYRTRPIQEP